MCWGSEEEYFPYYPELGPLCDWIVPSESREIPTGGNQKDDFYPSLKYVDIVGKENADLESVSHLTNTCPSVGVASRWHQFYWKDDKNVVAFKPTPVSVWKLFSCGTLTQLSEECSRRTFPCLRAFHGSFIPSRKTPSSLAWQSSFFKIYSRFQTPLSPYPLY